MSDGYNRVQLFGNLCADPDYRVTGGGNGVLRLRLATSERYQDRDKQWKERTEYHSVTVWGKRGEALSRILAKGDKVFIEGSLRTSSYEKDGDKRYRTEVVAREVLLGGRGRGGGENRESKPAETGAYPDEDYGAKEGDDGLPF